MKIDLTQTLKSFDGKPLTEEVWNEAGEKEKKEVLANSICVNALMGTLPDERQKPLSSEQRLKAFTLAERIIAAEGDTELSAEEVANIKKRVGLMFSTMVVGNMFRILENVPEVKK